MAVLSTSRFSTTEYPPSLIASAYSTLLYSQARCLCTELFPPHPHLMHLQFLQSLHYGLSKSQLQTEPASPVSPLQAVQVIATNWPSISKLCTYLSLPQTLNSTNTPGKMRYQGWDVLIFPGNSKIPIQEFKTGCHVVQDHGVCLFQHHSLKCFHTYWTFILILVYAESASLVPGTIALPTVTCFIPGLPYGVPFRISVHCWDTPEISRYTQNYSKHPENVMYEARVFIDGKLSG